VSNGRGARVERRGGRTVLRCWEHRSGREDLAFTHGSCPAAKPGAVLTEHREAAELGARGEEAAGGGRLVHERGEDWLQQADVVLAEVTQPSLGAGYELGRAAFLDGYFEADPPEQMAASDDPTAWLKPTFLRPSDP
uniref:Uncharacterized protein n=1 Tax=Sciurus vulgaris TaxID=55149 RepID=A0A8D2BAD1_SCIVU